MQTDTLGQYPSSYIWVNNVHFLCSDCFFPQLYVSCSDYTGGSLILFAPYFPGLRKLPVLFLYYAWHSGQVYAPSLSTIRIAYILAVTAYCAAEVERLRIDLNASDLTRREQTIDVLSYIRNIPTLLNTQLGDYLRILSGFVLNLVCAAVLAAILIWEGWKKIFL